MVAVIVPVYWKHWGPKNFLWFSDLALFGLVAALWLESSLIASMVAVTVLLAEICWNLDLLVQLVFRRPFMGLTNYLFKDDQPLFVRLLTLFHIPLLAVIIYLLLLWGYDERAIYFQVPITWLIILATYWAKPEENINWVYGWGDKPQKVMPPVVYLMLHLVAYPLIAMLPVHYVLASLT
jgi:hypothetical protein